MEQFLTPALIAATAGTVISILFNYVPGLSTWFDQRSADQQRGFMAIAMILTGLGITFWHTTGADAMAFDWRSVALNIFSALALNQTADRVAVNKPRSGEVQ